MNNIASVDLHPFINLIYTRMEVPPVSTDVRIESTRAPLQFPLAFDACNNEYTSSFY